MSFYETLAVSVSLISVLIALISLVRTRKIAEEQLSLEKITAELSRKQITQIDKEESERIQPRLNVSLTKIAKSYHFIITNRGQGSAYDVEFELMDCADSPILLNEVGEKFPCPELRPDSRIKLIAGIHMGSPRTYVILLSWKDSNDQQHADKFHTSL